MYGYAGRLKTNAELEYERKYGGKSDSEINKIVEGMISAKFDEMVARAEQEQAEYDAKYNLPYSGLVKALSKTAKQIQALEGKPEKLRDAKKKELEAEYADLVMRGMPDINKGLWVGERLLKFMQAHDGDYMKAKLELQQVQKDYAIYLAKKEEWEQENADIINAERIRTKRAELMQADPEALRALGIEPDPVSTPVAGVTVDDGKNSYREALRSIHPSASDAEIEKMVKGYGE